MNKEKLFEPTIEDYKRLYSDKCDDVLKLIFDIRQAEQERDQYKEMFDMQTKLVVDLEMRMIKMEKKLNNEKEKRNTSKSFTGIG